MKASVLIVDDDGALRRALADRFRFWGHAVTVAENGEKALEAARRRAFDLILLDLSMPGISGLEVLAKLVERGSDAEKVVLTAHGSLEKAVEAMKAGADDFLSKPADFDLLQRVVERALENRRLSKVNQALVDRSEAEGSLIRGTSAAMESLLATAAKAAQSDTTLLVTGESGTGKQVLAEFIHQQSPRCDGPIVYVNCVAISDELIESTLFGHEKGSFTGAVSRKTGRLETAAGGTAFLDEVGDISAKLQTKLLHFLESGEFERVGGNQTIAVDCRIIAATNRDLQKEVQEGRFREDLFYRLNVITLHLPPLREHPEDIPILAGAFLERLSGEMKREGLEFGRETLEIMSRYSWPGNVRQLRNAVERMAVLAPETSLTPDLLPPEVLSGPEGDGGDLTELPYREAMDGFKKQVIRSALIRSGGNKTKAAAALGLQRTYLVKVIKELEIEI
jgi:DNA-binding NtrC family response regulator